MRRNVVVIDPQPILCAYHHGTQGSDEDTRDALVHPAKARTIQQSLLVDHPLPAAAQDRVARLDRRAAEVTQRRRDVPTPGTHARVFQREPGLWNRHRSTAATASPPNGPVRVNTRVEHLTPQRALDVAFDLSCDAESDPRGGRKNINRCYLHISQRVESRLP